MILVTRPLPEAEHTSNILKNMGYQTQVEPLLTIQPITVRSIHEADVVVFTSGNGVRYVPEDIFEWQPLVYTVGDNTAKLARSRGFLNVIGAGKDVHQLTDKLKNDLNKGISILHVCGRHSHREELEKLALVGFQLRECIVYDAIACKIFSDETAAKLKNNIITSALFFSPRTASIFVENVKRSGLELSAENLIAYCISHAVAKELNAFCWKDISVADEPTHDSLMSMLNLKGFY